ncbi:OmpP1/FadL family transporter [Pseudomonas indica]|uniref:Long-chain fatty acid transport protein n=1 Tax=Pseudomonas indica TaxID=137658 RepID=A0A1G9J3M1_9PSED|nr:outer membrane protein transport protein [Pseudomonas indica]SDL32100.1 Long-chain fatty acid transport protein [Pseudomonas indica]
MTIRLRVAIALALMSSNSAFALTDEEGTSGIQFNFSNPGARSLSMGGAFLALADDATAAYANPAGLTQLSRRELSVEGRHYRYSTPHLSDAHGDFMADYQLEHDTAESSASGVSFLSAVFPFEFATLALYRHEQMDFNTRFDFFTDDSNVARPFSSRIDLSDVSYGASVGFAIGERLRLGAGIAWHEFEIDSVTTRDFGQTNPGLLNRQTQKGKDHGVGYTLGLRYLLSDQLALGAVYRRSPRLRYEATFSNNLDDLGEQVVQMRKQSDFDIPDVLGVGLSYRVNEALTLNLDVNRILYSQLTRNLSSAFLPEDVDQSSLGDDFSRMKLRDGTEIRFGGEYVFFNLPVPVSLRAGVWRDPEHTIHYRDDGSRGPNVMIFSARTGDQTHYTFGMGMAFEQFSVDFGADFSRYYDTFSLAAVARF